MASPKGHAPYPGCETGGRPKTYNTERIEKEADELLLWLKLDKFKWFEKFALERGYDPDYMSEWAEENEKFRGAYRMAKAYQKIKLIENGLDKKFNYNMVQLLLGHHYGIFQKQETKLSGDPASAFYELISGTSNDLVVDNGL